MRYIVRCTARGCYLHNEARFADAMPAELLAFAHEQRNADKPESHVVMVTEEVHLPSNPQGGNSGAEGRPA